MEKNDFKEMCKCVRLDDTTYIAPIYSGFKRALANVKNSIDAKQFDSVYTTLGDSGYDAQLFTLLCLKNGINPFNFTHSTIPSRSLYELTIPKGNYYENCLLDCLRNLPKNTNIAWRSCFILSKSRVIFNNIANIDSDGLRITAPVTEINGNEIFINEDGVVAYSEYLSINCKALHLKHRSLFGAVGDLTLNVEEIFIHEGAIGALKVDCLRISKSLCEEYGRVYFMGLFNCDKIIVL